MRNCYGQEFVESVLERGKEFCVREGFVKWRERVSYS